MTRRAERSRPGSRRGTRAAGRGDAPVPASAEDADQYADELAEESPRRLRRALSLIAMTLVLPGAAQYVAGNRGVGRAVLRAYGIVIGLALLTFGLAKLAPAWTISVLTNGTVLTVLTVALWIVAGIWLLLFVDALRLAEPNGLTRDHRLWVTGVAFGLTVVVVATLLTAAHYVDVTKRSIADVFTAQKVSNASDGRYNVLLLGGDAGADRIGLRPDSMTLLSIDARTGRTAMFSFPRNLQKVPFPTSSPMHKAWPNGFDCGDVCLLNAVNTWAEGHHSIYPAGTKHPGIQATREAIEGLTGLKINYYVLVDMGGFKDLVDAVGGITVEVGKTVPVGTKADPYAQVIKPGTYHFDGAQALLYSRARVGLSDYYRMNRQRCVMSAMLDQLDPATVLRHFESIANAGTHIVQTDIPASELGTFVELARQARSARIESLQFVPPLIHPQRPDFGLIRRKVAQVVGLTERPAGSSSASAGTPGRTDRASDHGKTTGTGTPGGSGTSSSGTTTRSEGSNRSATQSSPTPSPNAGGSGGTGGTVADLGQVCAAG